MVTQSRRPLAERVQNIGAWYGILKGLTYTAVVSNVSRRRRRFHTGKKILEIPFF